MDPEYADDEYESDEYAGIGGGLPGMSAADALKAAQDAQRLVQEQVSRNRAMLQAAAQRLREERVGPSVAERLFALSRAFSQPTQTGRFGERMGIVGQVLGAQEQAKREAERERAALLERYGVAEGNEALKAAMLQAQLAERMYGRAAQMEAMRARQAAAANKPDYRVLPPGGSLVDVKSYASLPVLTPEQVAQMRNDPANRGMRFRTVDGRLMEM